MAETLFGDDVRIVDTVDGGYKITHLPSGNNITVDGGGFTTSAAMIDQILLSDYGVDPVTSGEVVQNGGDVKVYTGGQVKNLSNIGGGGSYSDEQAQDAVQALLTGGSNISLSYDDADNTLTIAASIDDTQLSPEEVQDIVGGFVTSGGATSVTYDDANNTLEISSSDTQLSNTEVRSAVEGDTDVADLSGSSGSSGQIPETDGTTVSWVSPTDTNTQAYSLAASGSTSLSSGAGTANTGVSTDSGHYDVSVNPGGADIAVSLDGGGTSYHIHMEEHTTSVGNPTVGWQLLESNL